MFVECNLEFQFEFILNIESEASVCDYFTIKKIKQTKIHHENELIPKTFILFIGK